MPGHVLPHKSNAPALTSVLQQYTSDGFIVPFDNASFSAGTGWNDLSLGNNPYHLNTLDTHTFTNNVTYQAAGIMKFGSTNFCLRNTSYSTSNGTVAEIKVQPSGLVPIGGGRTVGIFVKFRYTGATSGLSFGLNQWLFGPGGPVHKINSRGSSQPTTKCGVIIDTFSMQDATCPDLWPTTGSRSCVFTTERTASTTYVHKVYVGGSMIHTRTDSTPRMADSTQMTGQSYNGVADRDLASGQQGDHFVQDFFYMDDYLMTQSDINDLNARFE